LSECYVTERKKMYSMIIVVIYFTTIIRFFRRGKLFDSLKIVVVDNGVYMQYQDKHTKAANKPVYSPARPVVSGL